MVTSELYKDAGSHICYVSVKGRSRGMCVEADELCDVILGLYFSLPSDASLFNFCLCLLMSALFVQFRFQLPTVFVSCFVTRSPSLNLSVTGQCGSVDVECVHVKQDVILT